MEKRIAIKIDSKGNVSGRTVSGFQGENCQEAMDNVFADINGDLTKQGKTDDADKGGDPLEFIVND